MQEDTWDPLPPRVRRKHGAFYFVDKHVWTHLGRSARAARARFKQVASERGVPHVDLDFISRLHVLALRRAKRKKVEFTLSPEDVAELWKKSKGRCALTGIRFDEANVARFARRPWVPSLDRKDATKGYTPENARLICCAMNFALNSWGEEVFERVAREFLARREC
jgi:hypothetical protein